MPSLQSSLVSLDTSVGSPAVPKAGKFLAGYETKISVKTVVQHVCICLLIVAPFLRKNGNVKSTLLNKFRTV